MTSTLVRNEASDEHYLVSMARKYHKTNKYVAKSWIITAKSLFPDHFTIHFEAYQMSKEDGAIKEAAISLEEMIRKFPCDEPTLWMELKKLADSLHPDHQGSEFYRELFSSLSAEIQPTMLLTVAENCKDTIEHCKLMLLLLSRFPSRTQEYGNKLIETLLAAEKHYHLNTPKNQFRKLLVCDVVPLLLTCAPHILKQTYRLLLKCVEFYVVWLTQQDSTGLWEEGLTPETAWDKLYALLSLAATKLEWEVGTDVFSPGLGPEVQWSRVAAFLHRRPHLALPGPPPATTASNPEPDSLEDWPPQRQVFFCGLVVFFRSIYNYGRVIYPDWFSAAASPEATYLLFEGIYSRPISTDGLESKIKKRKLDYDQVGQTPQAPGVGIDGDILLTLSRHAPLDVSSVLPTSFIAAFKCWELLRTRYYLVQGGGPVLYYTELVKFTQPLHMDKWPWFQDFCINSLIYQGFHKDAVEQLRLLQVAATRDIQKNKATLQLASCYYALGNTKMACENFLDVIASLPTSSSTNEATLPEPLPRKPGTALPSWATSPDSSSRHLHFIGYRRSEILQHCVQLLIKCFREKCLLTGGLDDMALGHLLILLQYDWPREEQLFLQMLENLRTQGHFTYNLFFTYIINPDIIEELMYLTTSSGGGVALDLLPSSSTQISKQRAVTRGANKGAKEELKQTVEKQMARWEENLEQLLVNFLTNEQNLLLLHL